MHCRITYVVLSSLGMLGVVAAAYLAAQPSSGQAAATLLFPKETKDHLFWPTNQSWLWAVKSPEAAAKGKTLAVVARIVHERLPKGESPAIGPRTISKADSEMEISPGKIVMAKPPDSAVVCVQLIDLGQLGVAAEKRPLRLLLHLQIGGTTISRTGEQSAIEGDRFMGQAPSSDARWKDDELHLQTLIVQTGERVAIYDIVVVRSE